MKNMSNKKVLTIGLIIIAVCLGISGIYMFTHRTTKREPTQAELQLCAAYDVSWDAVAAGAGEKTAILSLCQFAEEKTIGQNVYDVNTSETLPGYLYNCAEVVEIGVLEENLYIQYNDLDGNAVTMGYTEEGLVELAVYFQSADLLFYQQGETVEVWENFRAGMSFG